MRVFKWIVTGKFVRDKLSDVLLEERLSAEGERLVLLLYAGHILLNLENNFKISLGILLRSLKSR